MRNLEHWKWPTGPPDLGAAASETMRQIPEDIITPEGARRRHIVGPLLVTVH